MEPYTRAQRLLNLTTALRASRIGLDRATIRAQVRGYDPDADDAAFLRMFERDKDLLRAMGIPLNTRTDAMGNVLGYAIPGDWTLPPLDLSAEELALLALATRAWSSSELGPAAVNALRKVETRLGLPTTPSGEMPSAAGMALSVDSAHLDQLRDAVRSACRTQFAYHRAGRSHPERRDVTAWGLAWWRGHWYLVGHDTDRDAVRVFRASRIEGALRMRPELPAQPRPAGFDARSAVGQFAWGSRVRVTAALRPGVGASLRLGGQVSAVTEDGEELVVFEAEDLARGVAEVIALGDGARVVAPPAAVDEARRQLEAILDAAATLAPEAGRVRSTTARSASGGTAQFSRLLALIPWLVANSGISIAAAADHFGVSERQLLADLGAVITSGPDDWTLFDIQYWDAGATIQVIDALTLTSALSLTPEEGFALVIALDALTAGPGEHDRTRIDRLAAKVRAVLGELAPEPGEVGVRVDLPGHVLAVVGEARHTGRTLEIDYLGEVRDEVTARTLDPLDVVVVDGMGYLRAHCRLAGAPRTFRLDRILRIEIGSQPSRPVPAEPEPASMASQLARSGTTVLLDASPAGLHLIDRVPVLRAWDLPDGWVRAEVAVGDPAWAVRLVLGSGGGLVVREPAAVAAQVKRLARHGVGRLGSADPATADASRKDARGVASGLHAVT